MENVGDYDFVNVCLDKDKISITVFNVFNTPYSNSINQSAKSVGWSAMILLFEER